MITATFQCSSVVDGNRLETCLRSAGLSPEYSRSDRRERGDHTEAKGYGVVLRVEARPRDLLDALQRFVNHGVQP